MRDQEERHLFFSLPGILNSQTNNQVEQNEKTEYFKPFDTYIL